MSPFYKMLSYAKRSEGVDMIEQNFVKAPGEPLPKMKASGANAIMKSGDGNDSIDTFIRQAIGKDPFLSFSRPNNSPVQWIQLLHALDRQDLPGWPLLAPLKVQMQKCDKCSREFCSTINYRRHMRLHRRNLNLDKDSTTKNRGLLQAFWDKLSVEEGMEIMSFKYVSLEGVSWFSIVKALTSLIRKPEFTSLPQSYIKAGSALLDILQARPSRFPISSQELFDILDDASEKTFLCAGTAESLQKYVFDGEAGKIGLETRNLVACASFLVEQQLVKACLADKDAEALRYQKLLVEEEEVAQKRQAALLEKKRQKKLRQKEQRKKEQASPLTDDSSEYSSPSPPTSSAVDTQDSNPEISDISQNPTFPKGVQIMNVEGDTGTDHVNGYPDLGTCQNVEHRTLHRISRRHVASPRWPGPKLRRIPIQKHASYRDSRAVNAANEGKVWTPKPKAETDEESYKNRLQIEGANLPRQVKKSEVFIGSISVTLGYRDGNTGGAQESCALELPMPEENGIHEKPAKIEIVQGIANRSTVKLWRPVRRHENGVGRVYCNNDSEVPQTCLAGSNSNVCDENFDPSVESVGGLRFSSQVAEAFLTKRWKEAISSEHVKLVLFSKPKPPGDTEVQDNDREEVPLSKSDQSSILSSMENRLSSFESSGAVKAKIRAKPEKKGSMAKYIPKQRSIC